MVKQTQMQARITRSSRTWWVCLLVGVMTASSAAMAAGEGAETYRWHGELVALGEGAQSLTVKARMVSGNGLADTAGLRAGDPIVITWSGFETWANGIRAVAADDGAGLAPGDRFRLRAQFEAMEPGGQYLTFKVAGRSSRLRAARLLTPGSWATVTSPHRPAHGPAGGEMVAAYAAAARPMVAKPPLVADATYRWQGELVALDAGGEALTVRSRLVSAESLADGAGLSAGDPILITWSGFEDRTDGIRTVAADTGSELWGSDRFLLQAQFEAVDPARRYLTFTVMSPAGSATALRMLTRGTWATLRSPHQPRRGQAPVETIAAYAPIRGSEKMAASPAAGDTYRWQGELVALDATGETLTMRSRVVSAAGAAGLAGLSAGDPIVITWSGFEDRANGIRTVTADDGSGLWGTDRFVLRAQFEAVDPGGYLTFTVVPPRASVPTIRGLRRGTWATVTSPHRPAPGTAPVSLVAAYTTPARQQWAGMRPRATDTYQWHGELMSIGGAGRSLTMRSRMVSREGAAGAENLATGDPIVITWSGFEDRANGIRTVTADDGSGLWGTDRFVLQASFVAMDPARQYLTFMVMPPADTAPMMRELTAGDWAIVTSPHRPMARGDAVAMVDAYDPAQRARRYVWSSDLVALDGNEMTVSAPVEEHVFRYVDRFSAGDQVVLIWTPGDNGEVGAIRYLESREQSALTHGYVLPVEFVAANAGRRRLTFKTKVVPRMARRLGSMASGHEIKVTSLFDQPRDRAEIVAVEQSEYNAE